MSRKYRVAFVKDISGKDLFHVEEKRNFFSNWRHVYKSTQYRLHEAEALKTLLEMGETQFSIYRPSARLKDINDRKS